MRQNKLKCSFANAEIRASALRAIESQFAGGAATWEERYVLYADSSPIVGASLEILNRMLKAA
jgi:hypothetical protein